MDLLKKHEWEYISSTFDGDPYPERNLTIGGKRNYRFHHNAIQLTWHNYDEEKEWLVDPDYDRYGSGSFLWDKELDITPLYEKSFDDMGT